MKLKYYLRGLGIGIVVTALLMGFATKGKGEMSDEEIRARAAELGMVEQLTLADIKENSESGNQTEAPAATDVPNATKEPVMQMPTEVPVAPTPTEKAIATAAPEATAEPAEATKTPADLPENTEAPEALEPPADGENTADPELSTEDTQPLLPTAELSGDTVYVTIYEGNNSVNVSRVLAASGLIEDATAFDRYLRNNGYSKIINTGSYKISLGTSEAEIARIITNTD